MPQALEIVRHQIIAMGTIVDAAAGNTDVVEIAGNLHYDKACRDSKTVVDLTGRDLGVEWFKGSRLFAVKSVGVQKGLYRLFEIHENYVDVVRGIKGMGREIFQLGGELDNSREILEGEFVGDSSTGTQRVVVSASEPPLVIPNNVVHGHDPIHAGDVDPEEATATVLFGKVYVPDGVRYKPY